MSDSASYGTVTPLLLFFLTSVIAVNDGLITKPSLIIKAKWDSMSVKIMESKNRIIVIIARLKTVINKATNSIAYGNANGNKICIFSLPGCLTPSLAINQLFTAVNVFPASLTNFL